MKVFGDGKMVERADRELRAAGYDPDSPEFVKHQVYRNVMELVRVFSDQKHSGMSAGWIMSIFNQLVRGAPLAPLTGADSEWVLVDEAKGLYQNIRCARVFKEGDRAYDIEAKVFRSEDGVLFTSKDSIQDVTFPYTPDTLYVPV